MSAWPSRSRVILGWIPCASSKVAVVCRRSWKYRSGRLGCLLSRLPICLRLDVLSLPRQPREVNSSVSPRFVHPARTAHPLHRDDGHFRGF
jgi:hypothetical protein